MQRYDFEVLKGDAIVAAERSIMLRNSNAAWPRIAKLAMIFETPGYLIRVKDESGDAVILVGVATVRRSLRLIAA